MSLSVPSFIATTIDELLWRIPQYTWMCKYHWDLLWVCSTVSPLLLNKLQSGNVCESDWFVGLTRWVLHSFDTNMPCVLLSAACQLLHIATACPLAFVHPGLWLSNIQPHSCDKVKQTHELLQQFIHIYECCNMRSFQIRGISQLEYSLRQSLTV